MFQIFKKKSSLHIPFLNGESTNVSEVESLRTKERIFLTWAIIATLLLLLVGAVIGFFYLKNHVFELGVKAGEQASYKRLYTSVQDAGCRPIDISAPEGSAQGAKVSLLNMACFMQPQRSNSGTIIRNGR
ncbi:MAG: hypothetical protein U0518_00675 [Candidatus Gracilibacteria bacterium]